jgi:hypothetical protein
MLKQPDQLVVLTVHIADDVKIHALVSILGSPVVLLTAAFIQRRVARRRERSRQLTQLGGSGRTRRWRLNQRLSPPANSSTA